ncbi:hypothetical protein NUU61_007822 [Penicillium alfredii]|uniref:Metalloproteases (Zincins), catalytic n=1 Tax=Penicillium alfredii TaxID=1506179 RepID=A0A9W9ERG0_9EURO|nr:uncharacterized protein NUU61_007822 [Penicillium alfredii]KAJ5086515.1 hypothetical protein NUU61_007822 [Penicillium alfredii]
MILPQLSLLIVSSLLLGATQAAPASNTTIKTRDDGDDVHAEWTWLHFQDCSSSQQKAIKQAHTDAVKMAEHVKEIDFGNDPGALEYLGPSPMNKAWQGNIKSVYEHISTFQLNGFWPGYRMNARCGNSNDAKYSGSRCSRGVTAYQWNTKKDAKDPNTAPPYNKADAVSNMHFCDIFFNYKKLDDTIKDLKDIDDFRWRYDLDKYRNQAYIILHEMMHATVMTYKQNKNRRITDMTMHVYEYKKRSSDRGYDRKLVKMDAYKALPCKILARTARQAIAEEAITMNADNYAQYALADKEAHDWMTRSSAVFLTSDNGTFGINQDRLDQFTQSSEGAEVSDIVGQDVGELSNKADSETLSPDSDYPESFRSEMEAFSKYYHVPEPKCARQGDAPSDRSPFTTSEADEKIKDFCKDEGFWDTVFTPPINQGTGQTKDGKGKALGASGDFKINDGKDKLWIGAYFAGGGCTGFTTWPPKGKGLRDTDLCIDRLRTIMNSCDTDTTDKKYGGSLKETCLVYQLMAVGSDNSDPTGVGSNGDHGDIKCKDTDTSILGSHYDNTCTCWFEKLPDQTEIFGMPKKGDCDSMDFRPAWSFSEDPDYRPENIQPTVTMTASP